MFSFSFPWYPFDAAVGEAGLCPSLPATQTHEVYPWRGSSARRAGVCVSCGELCEVTLALRSAAGHRSPGTARAAAARRPERGLSRPGSAAPAPRRGEAGAAAPPSPGRDRVLRGSRPGVGPSRFRSRPARGERRRGRGRPGRGPRWAGGRAAVFIAKLLPRAAAGVIYCCT